MENSMFQEKLAPFAVNDGVDPRHNMPPAAEVALLAKQLTGELILPGDPSYDTHRKVWNGMIDKNPALIARCANTQDVVAAVNFAREHQLLLAVRGGGHNVAGHATCDGGLVIDLAPMRQIEVNVEKRLVAVQGGATWGDVDAATQPYGLATPGGVFSKTGVAGLALGGGYGWLRNHAGLSCDNIVAAEVVTADGSIVWASPNGHVDLLWALRGGGGNFGVVTTFVMQLHPVGPDVAFTFVMHDGEGDQMKAVLQRYRDFSATAPDQVSTIAAVGMVPPEPEVYPVELHGKPFVLLGGLYVGSVEEGERRMAPLRQAGTPLIDVSGIQPYVEVQQSFDHDYPDGRRYYWKSLNVQSLSDDVLDIIVDHARRQPSPFSTIDIWPIGGAVRRVGPEHGAFYGRHANFMINAEANWLAPADDAANRHWVTALQDDLAPHGDGSRYLNFPGFQEEGQSMMQQSFGQNYARLVEVKQRYDPHNLFRLNQNIVPAN
jgi:FAD/FMN-containing dehydrogenase